MRLAPILFLSFFNACECSFADEILTSKRQSFNAAGVSNARFETGGGKLVIDGRLAGSTIEVVAEYRGRAGSQEEAQRIIDNLKLTMEVRGSTFYLNTDQAHDWGWKDHGYIDLTISLPAGLNLDIHDGAGSMSVSGIDGDVAIEDGSGDIEVDGAKGNLKIGDGSGSIRIENVAKNVQIHDGSGSIHVKHVGGDVWIEDGSGSIDVTDVAGRLEVPSGGSGSIHYSEVRGEVRVPKRRS